MMASNDPMDAVDCEVNSDENGTRQSSLDRIKIRKQKVSRNNISFNIVMLYA